MCKPTNLTSGKVAILPVVVTKNLLLSPILALQLFYGDASLQLVNQRLNFRLLSATEAVRKIPLLARIELSTRLLILIIMYTRCGSTGANLRHRTLSFRATTT